MGKLTQIMLNYSVAKTKRKTKKSITTGTYQTTKSMPQTNNKKIV